MTAKETPRETAEKAAAQLGPTAYSMNGIEGHLTIIAWEPFGLLWDEFGEIITKWAAIQMSTKDEATTDKELVPEFLTFGKRTKEFIKKIIEVGCDFTPEQLAKTPWPSVLVLGLAILRHNFGGGLAHFFGHVSALRAEFGVGVPSAPTRDRSTSSSSSATDGEGTKSDN